MGLEVTNDHLSGSTSEQEQRAAARYVAAQAKSALDCRRLLDALGLLPNPRRPRKRTTAPGTTTADCPINTTTAGGSGG